MKKNNKRGGKREGAGRKSQDKRVMTFRLASDVAKKINEHKNYETGTAMMEDAVRRLAEQ